MEMGHRGHVGLRPNAEARHMLSMEAHPRYGMIHPTLLDGATSNRGYPASNSVAAYIAPPPEEILTSKADMRKMAAWIEERLIRCRVDSALAEATPDLKPTDLVEAIANRFEPTFEGPSLGRYT